MNIFNLVTKNNIRILKLIDKKKLHIREIADKLRISPGTVHKLVKQLKKNGLITEIKQKNKNIIEFNRNKPAVKELKRLINFNQIINAPTYKKLQKIGNMGIYGSFSNGTNDSESDLDIWIKTNKKELELRHIIKQLEKELQVKVNPLILTKSKIKSLEKKDYPFYIRLKLTSIGDSLD